jgi:1-acyl-sn-glycerol-3-phosphate acyltransferase
MTRLRSAVFFAFMAVVTIVLAVAGAVTLLMPRAATYRLAVLWSRAGAVLLRHVCGLRHRVLGRERVPAGPVIYALKHQSAWETVVFPHLVPPVSIVLKRELLAIPFYGWYLQRIGMIPIDRQAAGAAIKAIVREARRQVANGRSVLIMPEGTRMAPGRAGRYHPGVAALSSMLDLPVVPVALNSGLFWSRQSLLIRPGTVTVEFLEPISPGLDRRELLERLKSSIEHASEHLQREAERAMVPA